jgi:hypothetical protein
MNQASNLLPGVPLIESPLFETIAAQAGWSDHERAIAIELREKGYAVIDFPDADIDARIERIKSALAPRFGLPATSPAPAQTVATLANARVQDAWKFDKDVRAVATNEAVLDLLSRLYGRRAFPFQTLNFPVGTQQHLHADAAHFSSLPERFMCGVWLALEDLAPDSGLLQYIVGSHRWPILSNAMLGLRGSDNRALGSAQTAYEPVWRAMVEQAGATPETFLARKGQALIWAANLLHGGGPRSNPGLTRWSQVTHYYFEDCLYYTPAYSDEAIGQLDLRHIVDVASGKLVPNAYQGQALPNSAKPKPPKKSWLARLKPRRARAPVAAEPAALPKDFNAQTYLALNPDIAAAQADPAEHYIAHGQREGRAYCLE